MVMVKRHKNTEVRVISGVYDALGLMGNVVLHYTYKLKKVINHKQ